MKAIVPPASQRMPMPRVTPPHPSTLTLDVLARRVTSRTQARSGPGGQHRNRTASGVFLTYQDPHDAAIRLTAEATEGRHQAANRTIATRRLRELLAISLRTDSILDGPIDDALEREVRTRTCGGPMRFAEANEDRAAVLALVLSDMHAAGGQPSLVSPRWKASTSRIIGLLKAIPPAWTVLGRIRQHHQRLPLR